MEVGNIGLPATSVEVHSGTVGNDAQWLFDLTAPFQAGVSAGCLYGAPKSALRAINVDPSSYYVIVTNDGYPSGAIRGQLQLAP